MDNDPKLSQSEPILFSGYLLHWEPKESGRAWKRWVQSFQGPPSLTKRKASQGLERMKPLFRGRQWEEISRPWVPSSRCPILYPCPVWVWVSGAATAPLLNCFCCVSLDIDLGCTVPWFSGASEHSVNCTMLFNKSLYCLNKQVLVSAVCN